ncbi:MAG: cation transporter [Ruminococcaceae bacterium]|nr:cation transporter [Oscillospiraceae bacterium]
MLDRLIRHLAKNGEDVKSPTVRRACGTFSSLLGILLNILLFAAKLLAGLLSGSLSICADAVNNLSDAGSSVISLISFKIAAKPADREHPFGHARIEYVASMIVAFLILFIGVELVRGSVEKLSAPETPLFSILSIIILSASVAIKLCMGLFNRRLGKRIDSEVVLATGVDCLSDAAATGAVLIATVVARFLPAPYNAYVDPVMGLLVAALILWAGLKVLNDTKNSILGEAPDPETVEQIRRLVAEYPEALGIHDLYVHQYGPGRIVASLHVEVDGKKDVFATHDTIDLIERRLQQECNILCTIHLDPIVTNDERLDAWRQKVTQMAQKIDNGIKIHDFRMVPGPTHTNMIFDMEVPFDCKKTDKELQAEMAAAVSAEDPDFFTVITVDRF